MSVHVSNFRSEDMFVHVSTCTTYDFDALTPVVWKLWLW